MPDSEVGSSSNIGVCGVGSSSNIGVSGVGSSSIIGDWRIWRRKSMIEY